MSERDPFIIVGNKISEDQQQLTHQNFIKTLNTLSNEVALRESKHLRELNKNRWLIRSISYPAMLFSGLATFSGFVQFSTSSNLPACGPDLWLKITTTVFSILTLGFAITRDFFKFDTKVSKHEEATNELIAFYNTISVYKKLNKGYEGNRLDVINSLKTQLELIIKKSPTINISIDLSQSTSSDIDIESRSGSIVPINLDDDLSLKITTMNNLSRLQAITDN